MCKKGCFWNLATCSCENGKYARIIICNSVITSDEIIKETKIFPRTSTKIIPTKSTFYVLLAFSLITIALLITISIYLINHQSKQKHLL